MVCLSALCHYNEHTWDNELLGRKGSVCIIAVEIPVCQVGHAALYTVQKYSGPGELMSWLRSQRTGRGRAPHSPLWGHTLSEPGSSHQALKVPHLPSSVTPGPFHTWKFRGHSRAKLWQGSTFTTVEDETLHGVAMVCLHGLLSLGFKILLQFWLWFKFYGDSLTMLSWLS